MPRLSLYRPEKGNDFKFLDRIINEEFQVGGTDVFVHKYLGPVAPEDGESTPGTPVNTNPIGELGIQDVIFMENRDRNYDPDIYQIRGIYTMIDPLFDLKQFGLFLSSDNILVNFHQGNCVNTIGRRVMAGDVIELPHLKDEYALNDLNIALKRFYVITEVTRPVHGYSPTWYPHLIQAKCEPITDSQEFSQIFGADSGNGDGSTLGDVLSTYNRNIEINSAIVSQAELDAPLSGFDVSNLFVIPKNIEGSVAIQDASRTDIDASIENPASTAASVLQSPDPSNESPTDLYLGYLTTGGIPPNGAPYGFGISFPTSAIVGQFFLRTDFFPNRLFRFNGTSWIAYETNVRMTMTNAYDPNSGNPDNTQPENVTSNRETEKTSFINNNNTSTIGGQIIPERQALSKVANLLKPQADNTSTFI